MSIVWLMVRTWLEQHILPPWMADRRPDSKHPYRRLFTRKHSRKRSLVKILWIAAGALILAFPTLQIALAIALPVTLLSFVILDETP